MIFLIVKVVYTIKFYINQKISYNIYFISCV